MKRLLAHFVEKLFATKIDTPARKLLEDVANDIDHVKTQYEKISMKLIDIKYKEHVSKCHHRDDNGELWLTTSYLSYATLYFVKG